MNRRNFVAATAVSAMRVYGANERVHVGVVGAGGRGTLLLNTFKELGGVVAAVCDVYEPNLQRGIKAASPDAKGYSDHRAMLQDKSLDAVVVATPDHWHAQVAIDAANAGKDMYIEKPLAHTVDEGYRIIEAVRRNKRIAQVGTQRRSSELFQEAKQVLDSGQAGDVHLVNAWWVNYQNDLQAPQITGKLDWERWIGSTPKRALDPLRFRNWYYYWDYSGGMMVGQGAHVIDSIQWYMQSTYPATVTCNAVRPQVAGAEIPETTSMTIEFPEGYLAVFTVGYRAMRYHTYHDQMKQYHGTKARFDVGRESYALYPATTSMDLKPTINVSRPGSFNPATVAHVRNFLECVKSRKDPNATVEMGQHTNVVLCMAMESVRSGKRVRFNAAKRVMET
jgi:predicted dehydrogenase